VPSLPDFTDDFICKDFTEPWTDARNNYLENQVNAIKNSISCDFNKNATRDVVPQRLPMTTGFTKDMFRDSTNDGTTMESTAGFTKDMSGLHK